MLVDRLQPRAALALHDDIAFDDRFDGVSFFGVNEGAAIARYLQLIIQSSLYQYLVLLLDGQYGVEREVVHLQTIRSVPIVPWQGLADALRRRCVALSERLRNGADDQLLGEIDSFTFDVFGLSNVQRDAVQDTVATAPPTMRAKRRALQATKGTERQQFVTTCESELQSVLRASHLQSRVALRNDLDQWPWRFVQVDVFKMDGKAPESATLDPRRFLEAADQAAASLVMVEIDKMTTLIGVLDRYRYWTRTRARLLAASLLSESDRCLSVAASAAR
jgi:hypothetical protein